MASTPCCWPQFHYRGPSKGIWGPLKDKPVSERDGQQVMLPKDSENYGLFTQRTIVEPTTPPDMFKLSDPPLQLGVRGLPVRALSDATTEMETSSEKEYRTRYITLEEADNLIRRIREKLPTHLKDLKLHIKPHRNAIRAFTLVFAGTSRKQFPGSALETPWK